MTLISIFHSAADVMHVASVNAFHRAANVVHLTLVNIFQRVQTRCMWH